MSQAEIFKQTIERKKERLEELAQQPSGQRFLHHTVMGLPYKIRSSIPYTIVKNGLTYGREREANPETRIGNDGEFYSDSCGVYVLDDSFDSYREGSDTIQMMTLLIDTNVMTPKQKSWLLKERKYWQGSSPYLGEFCIDKPITPENVLGAIVPGEGHNVLLDFQTRPDRAPEELKREDKERYQSFDGKGNGTICNRGIGSFYRGLLWGMEEFPQNAFPVFSGFHSSHFPYESGVRSFFANKVDESKEIPLEFYLAQQIFPLTQEAYMQQVFIDMARKKGITPKQIGLAQRVAKGIITPEQALSREMTSEEKRVSAEANPKYDAERERITAEMALDNQSQDPGKI